jgi:hypothetical protein
VSVYRKGDVYRAVLEVPLDASSGRAEDWVSVLGTPELRVEWDPSVDAAEVVELFDSDAEDDVPGFTRLLRTTYNVGWPAK